MSKLKMLLLCGVAFGLAFSPVARADRYVVAPGAPGANPESPYDTWAKAATNIQLAVDAASAGETIWVSNGTYKAATGGGTNFAGVTTMVYIAKDVTLRSVNGPDVTILDGGYPHITNRVVALDHKATLSGFTVTNGCAGGGRRDCYRQLWRHGEQLRSVQQYQRLRSESRVLQRRRRHSFIYIPRYWVFLQLRDI